MAFASQLQPSNEVMITCSAQIEKLTHEASVPNMFRVTDHAYMAQLCPSRLEGVMEAASLEGIAPPVIERPVLARFGETEFDTQIAALQAH